MRLLIATGNAHKLAEIRSILQVPHLDLVSIRDFGSLPAVEEDGATFEANAIKKAVVLARASGLWTLSDDSGLEADALGGEPGVRSARYAGEPSCDAANNRKLLAQLENVDDRRARFRCVIALSDPVGVARTVSGSCEGGLLRHACGSGGFGYDPLFVPDGFSLTFAELEPGIKNRISHRARALDKAVRDWADFLATEPDAWPVAGGA
ncbi:MAG: RdgB/HAM1 family non-canonical purine NTP pyrophosphatase [bacterium]